MSKKCSKCGNLLKDTDKFCGSCGASAEENKEIVVKSDASSFEKEANDNINYNVKNHISKRDILVCVILTFVTCGIYSIVWNYKIQEDINSITNDNSVSPGMVVLLSIVTCGIYSFIWMYKTGERLYNYEISKGNTNHGNDAVVYLILSLFGLGIVSYCLIQSELNKYATAN